MIIVPFPPKRGKRFHPRNKQRTAVCETWVERVIPSALETKRRLPSKEQGQCWLPSAEQKELQRS